MLNHPHIARQLAQQRQREMVAQASHWRLRRQSLRGWLYLGGRGY